MRPTLIGSFRLHGGNRLLGASMENHELSSPEWIGGITYILHMKSMPGGIRRIYHPVAFRSSALKVLHDGKSESPQGSR
jgi:hypothetical protein